MSYEKKRNIKLEPPTLKPHLVEFVEGGNFLEVQHIRELVEPQVIVRNMKQGFQPVLGFNLEKIHGINEWAAKEDIGSRTTIFIIKRNVVNGTTVSVTLPDIGFPALEILSIKAHSGQPYTVTLVGVNAQWEDSAAAGVPMFHKLEIVDKPLTLQLENTGALTANIYCVLGMVGIRGPNILGL